MGKAAKFTAKYLDKLIEAAATDAYNESEQAGGLHAASVMELVTMREFDRLCLPSVEPLSTSKFRKNRRIA